jgi:hypothetical protein
MPGPSTANLERSVQMPRKAPDCRAALATVALGAVFIGGIVVIAWSWSQPFGSCAIQPVTDSVKGALSQYSETVKQVLTLSTALAGLGAALLLGLKEGLGLTAPRRILLLASVLCFVFSTYFALLWQSWLAELLLLGCPGLISQGVMWLPFVAHTNFFVIGLALIGLIVLSVTFEGIKHGEQK